MPDLRSVPGIAPLLLTCLCASALAAPRALVDRSLTRTDVDLIGWDEAEIAYHDDLGRLQREPVQNVLAILPSAGPERIAWDEPVEESLAGGTPVVVELVDGQRLIGSVGPWESASVQAPPPGRAGANGGERFDEMGGERVGVYSDAAGVRTVTLDRVSRVLLDPWSRGSARSSDWSPGVDDVLVFANGDRLRGFLIGFGEGVVFDDGAQERTFAFDQLAEVRLGNPGEAGEGPRVWSRGGEVIERRSLGFEPSGMIRMEGGLGGGAVETRVTDVLAAHLTDSTTIPLASLELVSASPAPGRRWTRPPRSGSTADAPLGTPHVALPGPMRAEWRLPPGARRFGVVVRLGGTLEDAHAVPGRWANAVVRVLVETRGGEVELASGRLDRASAGLPVAVELPGVGEVGRSLVIEVGAGLFGPIQDGVLLDRPMLATE